MKMSIFNLIVLILIITTAGFKSFKSSLYTFLACAGRQIVNLGVCKCLE